MRLRPYNTKDFDILKNWITDERMHALWCANHFKFPLEKENFEAVLADAFDRMEDTPFVATTDDGKLVGFFSYSVNYESNEGMLKFVMVDASIRGKGIGGEMLKLAAQYAFQISKAGALHLNVFPENERAKKCYIKAGFKERETVEGCFKYKDEAWGRCNMIIYPSDISEPVKKDYTKVELEPVKDDELEILHQMQIESFMPLYEKYHDEMSPAIEPIERIKNRAAVPNRQYYFIVKDGERVGVINIGHNDPNEKKVSFISPLFILPKYQNRGLGYGAIMKAFEISPEVTTWKLETILQEKGNCHLYEKCGFKRFGDETVVNDKMTLIMYELNLA